MNEMKPDAAEPSKASYRKLARLAELLIEIQARPETEPGLFQKFQAQYHEVPREERPWLFDVLLRRVETRKEDIEEQLHLLMESAPENSIEWSRLLTGLRRKMESPRMRAFRRFLNTSGGFTFLLDLRADVLLAQRQTSLELDPLDEELSHLFTSWFQHGLLFIQEITRESSFQQIRFLKGHDMVHPMASLEEMGNRLGEDRRCFALYHRAMPEEPVVFIEAALTRGIARSIHEVIRDDSSPERSRRTPDTAIFYSINNTQNGLAGLGLGKVLIFQVVAAIKKDHSAIKTFSSLSPIPGFWSRYLQPLLQGKSSFALKRDRLEQLFSDKARNGLLEHQAKTTGHRAEDLCSALLDILSDPSWVEDRTYVRWLKKPLRDITHFYVTKEKNRQGKPLNPVANFHMGNGATVTFKNINFGANLSDRGLQDSCGMMVNYIYSGPWLQEIRRTMRSWLPWNV